MAFFISYQLTYALPFCVFSVYRKHSCPDPLPQPALTSFICFIIAAKSCHDKYFLSITCYALTKYQLQKGNVNGTAETSVLSCYC